MARAILFTVITALVAINSRETFAKTTVNPLMADHQIVQHTGDTVLETTENSAIADPTITEHTGETNAGTTTVDSSTTDLEVVKRTWPDRLRACMKIFSASTCSILRFPKRIPGTRLRRLFILGTLAMAAMHAPIAGVKAFNIECFKPNGHLVSFNFPDPVELRESENQQYCRQWPDTNLETPYCTDVIGLECNFDNEECPNCIIDATCIDGYTLDDDRDVCVREKSSESREFDLFAPARAVCAR